MATASSDLADHLCCSICTDIYTEPVSLSYQHTFCKRCLQDSLNAGHQLCQVGRALVRDRIFQINRMIRNVAYQLKLEEDAKRQRVTAKRGNMSSTKLIECSTNCFSPESVQLVDGDGLCSGRLEVKSNQSNQSWASVCEADFDQQDAEVVCGELGCGAPAALQGGLYGEGEGQTWDKEFQCKGNESLLLDCDTSDRKNNTCLPGNAVGLTCSEPDDVRLVGGGSRCAGGLERYDQGEWRTVGAVDRKKEAVAAVVCRQLGCGSTVSVLPGNTTRGIGVRCSGFESSLRECGTWYSTYDLFLGFTVICSDLLVQPDIFLTDSMGGISRGHQGPEVFRGYNFTITCSTQPQYPGGSFLLTFTGSNRTQTPASCQSLCCLPLPCCR
ncbi:deleted in malignant brain tumors 1 protein-like [Coregonus clupeaformis]|uniref:deleted in malignant brain tumors 1 protein-like n=1 Tax=Coregonus clupeaformis TaxID=59861 RepID=UPI001E1C693C|nr:deleted in malignant brain tumors 1 protein-like [Coregonus clupeaformis]